MNAVHKQNGTGAFDVQAWRESRLQTYALEFGGEIQYKVVDVLAMLDDDGNAPNPLMAMVAGHTDPTPDSKKKKQPDKAITPAEMQAIRKEMDRIMIAVIVTPPLLEQGYEGGVSVAEFAMEEKQDIFTILMGGEQRLSRAEDFRAQPSEGLVVPQNGDAVRDATESTPESI